MLIPSWFFSWGGGLSSFLKKILDFFFSVHTLFLYGLSQDIEYSSLWYTVVLKEVGAPPGPKSGLFSNTQKWIFWGDTLADKAKDFIGKGRPGAEQQVKGTQESCSATWLALSGFMVTGLVPRLSLANHSDSGSFLVVCASFNQDGFQLGRFWEVGRTQHLLPPPFGPSQILLS